MIFALAAVYAYLTSFEVIGDFVRRSSRASSPRSSLSRIFSARPTGRTGGVRADMR